jgi:hypothetical protein
LLLVFIVFIDGCGGGKGGVPGSGGSSDTGILITVVRLRPSETGGDKPPDIDAVVHLCEDGDPEPGLFSVRAQLALGATKLNPNTGFDPFPGQIEECTITYRKAPEDPAAPIIESWTIYPNCFFVDDIEAGVNSCVDFWLIDVSRKVKWWNDFFNAVNRPSNYPTRYTAVYRCKYYNIYGEEGFLQTEYDFLIADFDNCGEG